MPLHHKYIAIENGWVNNRNLSDLLTYRVQKEYQITQSCAEALIIAAAETIQKKKTEESKA